MVMCFCGGGVGHTSTRATTNKFLQDCNHLDLNDGLKLQGDNDKYECSIDKEVDGDSSGSGGNGDRDLRDSEEEEGENVGVQCHSIDKDDGNGSGDGNGDLMGSKVEGGNGDIEDDEEDSGSADEEEDYGYGYFIDDKDVNNDEAQEDFANDALGPEDGDGDVDEANMLGFSDF